MGKRDLLQRPFQVRFLKQFWDRLAADLLADRNRETKCFLLCSSFAGPSADILLPRRYIDVPSDAYDERSPVVVTMNPHFVHRLLVECATNEFSLLEVHTHPWADNVRFSHIDLASDPAKFAATESMSPPFRHGSLVLGGDQSLDGHLWDYASHRLQTLTAATVLGTPLTTINRDLMPKLASADLDKFDRQVRMFGQEGQRVMGSLRVGLVGCGGLGSQVAQALALLGVRNFVLVDHDDLELSNANRVVGVVPDDFRRARAKVEAIAGAIERISDNQADITSFKEKVHVGGSWPCLAECDVLIGAVDSPSARQFLNRLAVALLIPYVDGGVGVQVVEGKVVAGGGQIQVSVPGVTPCRSCLSTDVEAEAEEQQTGTQREESKRRGYISGVDIPNPQVVFLNGTVANLVAWEVVKLATGCAPTNPYLYYDLLKGALFEPSGIEKDDSCPACSPDAWLACGPEPVSDLVSRWQSQVRFPEPRPSTANS